MSDELRQLSYEIDTDRGRAKDFSGGSAMYGVVNGDTVLFACRFQRLNSTTGSLENMDLTSGGTPQALRLTCRQTRNPSADLLTFQDAYNQGDLPSFEDLTKGAVTWKVSFNTAELDALFSSTVDSASVWVEMTILSNGGVPQTLFQGKLTVVQELDDGAVGTPPPTSPTYLTATEIALLYPGWDDVGYWADVIDKDLTAPPGGETTGDRYLVAAGATGDWTGQDGKVAVKSISGWDFYTPAEGWKVWLNDEDVNYVYSGSAWVQNQGLPVGTVDTAGLRWSATGNKWEEYTEILLGTNLDLLPGAGGNVTIGINAASGETPALAVSGYEATDARRTWTLQVGVDGPNSVSQYLDSSRVLSADFSSGNLVFGNGLGAITTGVRNLVLGPNGTTLTTARDCILIGYGLEPSSPGKTHELLIGNINSNAIPLLTGDTVNNWLELASTGHRLYFGPDTDVYFNYDGTDLNLFGSVTCDTMHTDLGITNRTSTLLLNDDATQDVQLFGSAASGETKALKVSGYASGDALRTWAFQVGVDGASSVSQYLDSTRIAWLDCTNHNLSFGEDCLTNITTGERNVVLGDTAGSALTSGYRNTLMGFQAGLYLTTGFENFALGSQAMGFGVNSHTQNVVIGTLGLYGITDGNQLSCSQNVIIGTSSGQNAYRIRRSVALGYFALRGAGNTAANGARGDDNVAIGYLSLSNIGGGIASANTVVGASTGTTLTTGDNNVLIGYGMDVDSGTTNSQFKLGATLANATPLLTGDLANNGE
jgi:hypothetical protein